MGRQQALRREVLAFVFQRGNRGTIHQPKLHGQVGSGPGVGSAWSPHSGHSGDDCPKGVLWVQGVQSLLDPSHETACGDEGTAALPIISQEALV